MKPKSNPFRQIHSALITAAVFALTPLHAAVVDTTGTTITLNSNNPGNQYIGDGTLEVSGGSTVELATTSGSPSTEFAMTNGLIRIVSGTTLRNGAWQKGVWTDNKADMQVDGTFDIWDGNPATIDALTGSGSILKGNGGNSPTLLTIGIMDGGGTFSGTIANGTGSIALTKEGSGTQILTNTSSYSGPTLVDAGTLERQGAAISSFRSATTIASGATMKVTGNTTNYVGGNYNQRALGSSGPTGTLKIDGAGTLVIANYVGLGNASGAVTIDIAMGSGSLIDIQSGALVNGGHQKATWTTNKADMNIASGAAFDIWDGNAVTIDALTGSGSVINGSNSTGNRSLTIGADNGSGIFTGVIGGGKSGGLNQGINLVSITKTGSGTQTLTGTNTYKGLTTVTAGTLQFAKTVSLYNSTTASWTAANISVANSGTLSLNVGGTDEFATDKVTTLLTNLGGANGTSTTGFAAGSTIAFDTTNASGGTFTVADAIADSTGTGGGAVGVTKLGTGTLVLSNTNTYTGGTKVSAGTLSLASASLADSSTVSIASGATLHLPHGATDTVATLVLGNTTYTSGTFNQFTPGSFISGTGSIEVGASTGFTGWINTNYPSLPDKTAGGDPDSDGIKNLMEYMLNGNPGTSSTNILPSVNNSDPTDLIFTFTRREESAADTTQVFQYGNDLIGWTPINITGTPGAGVTLGTPALGLQLVTVKVPKSAAAPSGKLFGRLQVTQP